MEESEFDFVAYLLEHGFHYSDDENDWSRVYSTPNGAEILEAFRTTIYIKLWQHVMISDTGRLLFDEVVHQDDAVI